VRGRRLAKDTSGTSDQHMRISNWGNKQSEIFVGSLCRPCCVASSRDDYIAPNTPVVVLDSKPMQVQKTDLGNRPFSERTTGSYNGF
jgi:hypothetical protein